MAASTRKSIKRAGLVGCKTHPLRHTHASRLTQSGMSAYKVREVLGGHTDISTTMRYAHLEARQVTSRSRDVVNRRNQESAELGPAPGSATESGCQFELRQLRIAGPSTRMAPFH